MKACVRRYLPNKFEGRSKIRQPPKTTPGSSGNLDENGGNDPPSPQNDAKATKPTKPSRTTRTTRTTITTITTRTTRTTRTTNDENDENGRERRKRTRTTKTTGLARLRSIARTFLFLLKLYLIPTMVCSPIELDLLPHDTLKKGPRQRAESPIQSAISQSFIITLHTCIN